MAETVYFFLFAELIWRVIKINIVMKCYIKPYLFGLGSYVHLRIWKVCTTWINAHVKSRHADVFIYIEVSRDDNQTSYFAQPRLLSGKQENYEVQWFLSSKDVLKLFKLTLVILKSQFEILFLFLIWPFNNHCFFYWITYSFHCTFFIDLFSIAAPSG